MLTEVVKSTSVLEEATGRYRERFQHKHDSRLGTMRHIGMESELPVCAPEVPFGAMSAEPMYQWLVGHASWVPTEEPAVPGLQIISCRDTVGNVLTYDAGKCTCELITQPHITLHDLARENGRVMQSLYSAARATHRRMMCYGCQPFMVADESQKELWVHRKRYDALFRAFAHRPIYEMMITGSLQCHVDVSAEEVIPVASMLNALAPWVTGIMANSPVWCGRDSECKVVRELVWDRCFPAGRVGIISRDAHTWMRDVGDWMEYLFGQALYCAKKDGEYHQYGKSLSSWVDDHGVDLDMVELHEGMIWPCGARPRVKFGTIEARCACQQPQGEQMTFPALCLGLVENFEKALKLIEGLSPSVIKQYRLEAVRYGVHWQEFPVIAQHMLEVAAEGLEHRGCLEEVYLAPLWDRLSKLYCPADRCLEVFNSGGLKALVDSVTWR